MWMYARFGKKYLHAPGFFGKEQSNNKNSKLRFQAEIIELSSAREAGRVPHYTLGFYLVCNLGRLKN